MKFRSSSKAVRPPVYKIASRIILLAAVCVAGATLLQWKLRDRSVQRQRNPETAPPPSPFSELGKDVFLANSGEVALENTAGRDGDPFGVDVALLQRVLDKTKGIPGRPYFHLVDAATRALSDELRQRAVGEDQVGYTNLWTQPDKHRGDVVLLKGRLRELVRFQVSGDESVNPSGRTALYQGALITEASHPYPYIVVVPSVPRGMPLGSNIAQDVTFAGFFLKLWRYKSASDVDRAAPLLIGRVVSWTPNPEMAAIVPQRRTMITLVVVAAILCVGTLIWLVRRVLKKRSAEIATGEQSNPTAIKASLASLEENYTPPAPFADLDHTEQHEE